MNDKPPSATLRDEFLRLLTEDSDTKDRRRKDYNQAIFAPMERGGYAIFTGTSLDMVMEKFDRAAQNAPYRPVENA